MQPATTIDRAPNPGIIAGDAYTFSELEAMHREAGFSGIEARPVPHSPHTVVTGIAG